MSMRDDGLLQKDATYVSPTHKKGPNALQVPLYRLTQAPTDGNEIRYECGWRIVRIL